MSMYVRVKREKLTVFLHVDPTDTVAMLKQQLQELLQQPAGDQRLYCGEAVLEDGQSLAELGIQNDDELGVAYRLPDGEFEPLHIDRFDQGSKAEDAAAG